MIPTDAAAVAAFAAATRPAGRIPRSSRDPISVDGMRLRLAMKMEGTAGVVAMQLSAKLPGKQTAARLMTVWQRCHRQDALLRL